MEWAKMECRRAFIAGRGERGNTGTGLPATGSRHSVRQRRLDRWAGMKRAEHHNRSNCGAGKFSSDISVNRCEPDDLDVEHLPGCTKPFKFITTVMPEPEIQALTRYSLLDHIRVAFELVADCGANEIRAVGIETLLHHQIDMTEVHMAEIDGDLFGIGRRPMQVDDVV